MKVASRQVITDKEIAALQLAKEPEPAKELPLALVAKDVLKNPAKKPAKKPAKIKDASARVASGSPKLPVTIPKKGGVDHERSGAVLGTGAWDEERGFHLQENSFEGLRFTSAS